MPYMELHDNYKCGEIFLLLNYYLQPLQQPQNRAQGPRLVLISNMNMNVY